MGGEAKIDRSTTLRLVYVTLCHVFPVQANMKIPYIPRTGRKPKSIAAEF